MTKAINSRFKDMDIVRLSHAMGNVIVGQLLPDGVVEGGRSLVSRYGCQATRYTRDMDIVVGKMSRKREPPMGEYGKKRNHGDRRKSRRGYPWGQKTIIFQQQICICPYSLYI